MNHIRIIVKEVGAKIVSFTKIKSETDSSTLMRFLQEKGIDPELIHVGLKICFYPYH